MEWSLDRARARGAVEIYLTVFDYNNRAKRFYSRHGLRTLGNAGSSSEARPTRIGFGG